MFQFYPYQVFVSMSLPKSLLTLLIPPHLYAVKSCPISCCISFFNYGGYISTFNVLVPHST